METPEAAAGRNKTRWFYRAADGPVKQELRAARRPGDSVQYRNNTAAMASAAGKACTYRILRDTVAAP